MFETASGTNAVAPPPATRSHLAGWAAFGVLLSVALILGGTAVALALQREPVTSTALPGEPVLTPQEAARLAACDFVRVMTTFQHTDLGPYFADMSAGSTGEMHDNFTESGEVLRATMEQVGSSSRLEGEPECLSRSEAGDEYTVVAIFTQHRTTFADPVGTPQKLSIALTMRKVGGRWLCAEADQV